MGRGLGRGGLRTAAGIDIVAQRFGWPEQTMRLVLTGLSVGFDWRGPVFKDPVEMVSPSCHEL